MSKLRNGTCYRHLKIPYTRTSKRKSKAFIVGIPGSKIVRFVLGEKSKKFDSQVVLISEKDINLRHNCLESARIASVRFIELKAGKNNFRLVIHPFPHHIMRENPIAAGAGADRFQKGMTHAFGKPYGRAARVKT